MLTIYGRKEGFVNITTKGSSTDNRRLEVQRRLFSPYDNRRPTLSLALPVGPIGYYRYSP